MELDDLKPMWVALESTRALNVELLRELKLGRARSALVPSQLMRGIELVLGVACVLLCAPVVLSHLSSWRYVVFGVPCLAFMAMTTGTSAYLLVRMRQLSFGGALLSMQREVTELRRVELRATLVALLGGTVLWLPIALLLFEAVTSSPLLEVCDLAWLVSNIVFGLVVLVVGRRLARRWSTSNRFVDALTGRGLRAVAARIGELDRF